jgi:DNA-binding response OmpR family regulator
VLVVDDDPVIREVALATLNSAGFVAEGVANGAEALKTLEGVGPWDLVLTDLDMPEVNGAELLRAIRNTEKTSAMPVIVLTGSSSERDHEVELIEAGANDYLRKPIDPPRVVARIRAALRRVGHVTR